MENTEQRLIALQRVATRFSIGWLLIANAIGVWLALLLVYPNLGKLTGDFGYGRWMPLHADWQLYGWCALPLLGVLLVRFLDHNDKLESRAATAFWIWTSAMIVGGLGSLLGEATGKPFLNWTGYTRWFFAISLAIVWGIVAHGWWEKRGLVRAIIVLVLGTVPIALFFVSDAKVYPPVNPESGGATGHSLLASTLGIVAIMGVMPTWGLELKRVGTELAARIYWIAFALSVVAYLMIQHEDASNREWDQIAGLGSLMVWPVLIIIYWRDFEWSESSRRWRNAFFVWWGLLALNGWITFLPGVLETLKFTNALVAHSHLAMAGMVTALNMVILVELGRDATVREALSRQGAFWLWNLALAVFVVVLTIQGFREGVHPGVLFQYDATTELVYWLRLSAGIAMLGGSFIWFRGVLKRRV